MRGDPHDGIIAPSTALPDPAVPSGVAEPVRLDSHSRSSRSRRRRRRRGHAKSSASTREMDAVLADVLAAFPSRTLMIAGELADKILKDRNDHSE